MKCTSRSTILSSNKRTPARFSIARALVCSQFLLLSVSAIAAPACLPVSEDRILGRDLARTDARFTSLGATLQLGYAPTPGIARVFSAPELERIARSNGIKLGRRISGEGIEDCFEFPVHTPMDAELLAPMRDVLPRDAALQIEDMVHTPIPAGRVEFPLSSLEPAAAGGSDVQLWRGFVQYTDTRRVALWARVRITVTQRVVVTNKDLEADLPIDATALRIQERSGPWRHEVLASRIDQVAGQVVRQRLSAGSEISMSVLAKPPAIRRGDLVRVEVQSGQAVLHFEAMAQTTARAGEYAELRNPITGKTFRARAEAGSRAVIVIGKDPPL